MMKTIKLGEIGNVCMCKRVLKEQTSSTGDIPFYKIKSFGNEADSFISKKLFDELKSKYSYPKKGDILLSAAGTIGKTVIFDGNDSYFQDSNIVWIDNNEKKVTNDYLYYFYQTNPWKITHGSTILRLYNDNIRNTKITYPENIEEQKRLTKILKIIDNKINNNKLIIENIEKTIDITYNSWFLDFQFPTNGKRYRENGGELVYNHILKKEIPINWTVKPLKDMVSKEKNAIVDGPFGTQLKIEEYDKNGDVPIFEMEQLKGNFIVSDTKHYINRKKFEDVKRSMVKSGDIIISKTGTLGLLGIVDDNIENGIIVSRLAKITADKNKIGKYTLYTYLNKLSNANYWNMKSGGSTMPILNNSILENVNVLVPNNDLYLVFENKLEPLFEMIKNCQKEIKKLNEIKNFILPLIISGKIKEVE